MHNWIRAVPLRRIEFDSGLLAHNLAGDPARRDLLLFLPPGYDDQPERRYPLVVFLAPFTSWGEKLQNLGMWDENLLQRADRLMRTGEIVPMIIALPDGMTRYGGSQYINSSATGPYQDYLFDEIVPLIERSARCISRPEARALMGYSSGGYGAIMGAIQRPGVFGLAASHSGDMAFDLCYLPDMPKAARAIEEAGGLDALLTALDQAEIERISNWHDALNLIAMSACYSPRPDGAFDLPIDLHTCTLIPGVWKRWQDLDPVRIAAAQGSALRSLRLLYFDCGLRDEFNLHFGARQFSQRLRKLKITHRYEEHGGGHGRIAWRYEHSLRAISRQFSEDGVG